MASEKKLVIIFLSVLAIVVIMYSLASLPFSQETVSEVIDLERSTAAIDMLGLTYVRVHTLKNQAVDEIRVNGESLERTVDENRWEIILPDLQAGNKISVVAIVNGKIVQEESLTVEDL